VKQIGSLLDLWHDSSRASATVKALALDHVHALEQRRRELDVMIATLQHLAHHCHGDSRPDCPILTGLSTDDETKPQAGRKKAPHRSFAVAG
jgi:DNA-binding transcriptional MerR regulator